MQQVFDNEDVPEDMDPKSDAGLDPEEEISQFEQITSTIADHVREFLHLPMT